MRRLVKKTLAIEKLKASQSMARVYASGAPVQCLKVGAANWGNKSKNNGIKYPHDRNGASAPPGMGPHCGTPYAEVREKNTDYEPYQRFGSVADVRNVLC